MSTYKHSTGKKFLLIHIPRTGGRFIEANLESSGWRCEPIDYCGIPHYNHSFIEDCEITHFPKKLYEKYFDVEGIPHIAVVRNPIDRFISASIYLTEAYGNNIQESAEDEDQLKAMIADFPMPESLGWFRQQIDYLSDKTNVWKFENGLGRRFSKWVSDIVGIDIKMDAFIKYPMSRREGVTQLHKTDKLIDTIKSMYKEDIEQLYPELLL